MSTIRNVPQSPPAANANAIRSGEPVKSNTQWLDMAQAANYLNSHEMTLLSAHGDLEEITSSRIYLYRIKPRQQIRCNLWIFVLRARELYSSGDDSGTTSPYFLSGTIQLGAGTEYSFTINGGDAKYYSILEDRSQTTTAYTQGVTITKVSGDDPLYVDQIACYQLRRYGLDPDAATSESAAEIASCQPGTIIKDTDEYSVDGVVDGIITAKTNCRRASMFTWYAPKTSGIRIGQGNSWNNLFLSQPEFLARYLKDGATVTSIYIRILAASGVYLKSVAGTSFAYIRAVADSGDSETVSIAYGAATAFYTIGLAVKTEDIDDNMGRQSSTADRVTFSVFGGSQTVGSEYYMVRLFGIYAGEED